MVRDALRYNHTRFHCGEVVLIQKAAKPRYNVVKSWRMIVLLSVFAKLVERIVLVRLAGVLDLGETQFGSRRRRGVHDAIANILEFLRANDGMYRMIISMDVKAGSTD